MTRSAMLVGRDLTPGGLADLQRRMRTETLLAANREFYTIWNPASERPTRFAYDTEQEAWATAEELARRNPTQKFYVMKSCGFAEVTQPVVRVMPTPTLPIPRKLRPATDGASSEDSVRRAGWKPAAKKPTAKKAPAKRKTTKRGGTR